MHVTEINGKKRGGGTEKLFAIGCPIEQIIDFSEKKWHTRRKLKISFATLIQSFEERFNYLSSE